MLIPTIIMGVLALTLLSIGYSRGQGQHITGLKSALNMTLEILPLLVFAFIVAGMIQALLPRELVSRLVGVESGLRGLLVGTVAGALAPGGAVCEPAHRRRATALRGRYWHHGRLPHRLVLMGRQPPAHGSGYLRLEIDHHPPGQHLLLPTHRRLDCPDPLRRDKTGVESGTQLTPPCFKEGMPLRSLG